MIKQYIPYKILIPELIKNHPPTNFKRFKKAHLIHILNLLTEIPSDRERFEDQNGFIPINAKKLQGRIHNYKEYIDYLLDVEIIETDGYYIPEEKSRGYRICNDFLCEVVAVGIKDVLLERKIRKDRQIKSSVKRKYEHLVKWFPGLLQIDYEPAMQNLQKEKEANIIGQVKNPYEKYNYTYRNIDRFRDKDYYISVDKKVGRFHSNFTNMKSEYRNFIKYGDEHLVSVDIRNSQPYLSTILFKPEFYGENNEFNIFSIYSSITSPSSLSTLTFPPPMLVKSSVTPMNSDLQRYRHFVQSGQFYEYLQEQLKDKLGLEYTDRKEVKEMVFSVFFSSNNFLGQEDAKPKRIFKKLFPTVYSVFAYLKKKDKTFLACLLQRIESFLILDIICKRIAEEFITRI